MLKVLEKKGATLRDWFEKEDWRRVGDPSKKCRRINNKKLL